MNYPKRVFGVLIVAVALVGTLGCGTSGRIKEKDEKQLVGDRAAGTALYDRIVTQAVTELLDQHQQRQRYQPGSGPLLVAFIGIDNSGAEELRDHREAIYDTVETVLVNAGHYRVISKRFIDAARREAGLRGPEDLFLAGKKERFLGVLQKEGLTPDYFLWGKMTTQTTTDRGGTFTRRTTERRYNYSMEMVNTRTGETESKVQGTSEKEYRS